MPYRDFVASGETDQDQKAGAKGFVDLFIEKRLLVADTDPQGEVTVSVAHEALLREWQRVKEWLDRKPRVSADAGPPGFEPEALAEPRKTKG